MQDKPNARQTLDFMTLATFLACASRHDVVVGGIGGGEALDAFARLIGQSAVELSAFAPRDPAVAAMLDQARGRI